MTAMATGSVEPPPITSQNPEGAPPDRVDTAAVPEVVYIMGASRSGSTILGVVLDQAKGTFYAGELCDWPERDGMSTVPHSQEFWDAVRSRFGPMPADAKRYKMLFEHPTGIACPSAHRKALRHEYEVVTRSVLDAVKDQAGCETVVDSSHYPRRARTLRRILGKGRVRLVFIVRRPSSVARSFRKTGDKGWLKVNAYLAVVGMLAWFTYLTHPKRDRVRISYESLTNSPVGTGARALGRALEDVDPTNMTPPKVLIGNRFVQSGEHIAIRPVEAVTRLSLTERLTDIFQWPYRVAGSYAAHMMPQTGRDPGPG